MKCEQCGQEYPNKELNKTMKNLKQFFELVKNQFNYGGKKYAHSGEKESTDVLFDDFGKNWLLGTIAKYIKRYSNLARERDLLKIATYMFIMWLKRGFHVRTDGTYKAINTNIDIKRDYFPIFCEKIERYMHENVIINDKPLDRIYNLLKKSGDSIFVTMPEDILFQIFYLAYKVWDKDTKNKGTDEDVNNEENNKKE